MKRGVPPTDRNARTGEFTPPGIRPFANANSLPEVVVFSLAKGQSLLPRDLVTGEKETNDTAAGRHCQDNARDFHVFFGIPNGIIESLDSGGAPR
jgi:hypothetical protein